MTIEVRGCEAREMTTEEQAQAQIVRDYFGRVLEFETRLKADDLRVEFAKVAPVPGDARNPTLYNDGEAFFVMEVSGADDSTVQPDMVRLYLMQMAFNAAAGTVRDTPPVLVRYFRGDLQQKGVDAVRAMFCL